MRQKKISESLTVRIFLMTVFILLCAGGITFGLIAWATPSTYTSVVNDELARQVSSLTDRLFGTSPEDCGALLDEFIRTSGASVMLLGPDGQPVDTGSRLAIQPAYEDDSVVVTATKISSVTCAPGQALTESAVTVTMSEESTMVTDVWFPGSDDPYALYVTPPVKAENLAVRALIQMAPWLLLVLLVFSLLCALVYSRYITRPIVRLSGIAGRMAELDFQWECGESRRDEIGRLGRSLDQMARRLSSALTELEAANHALRGEMEQERELERQRTAFFSAASHELKTPVTILKGQLSGMLEGVDVYRDRDKYLLRSLQVTGRMEKLIQELLAVSRMETGAADVHGESLDLAVLLERQISLYAELLEQREQRLTASLTPGISVFGDPALLGKAVGNLLSNASLYSPQGADIRIWCGIQQNRPVLTVENTGVHISEAALPHLFEAFYREEGSRNRSTGGSGLGLYLTRMILERHKASCKIQNTEQGVMASVYFPES